MKFQFVIAQLFSLKNFQDYEIANCFFEVINRFGNTFVPDKFDYYEPLKCKYSPENYTNAIELWLNTKANSVSEFKEFAGSHIILKKSGGNKIDYNIVWKKDNMASFNTISISISLEFFEIAKNIDLFLDFIRELTLVIEPVFVTVRNAMFNGWDEPINLSKCLPNMGWLTIYGLPYLQMIGKSQMLNTPLVKISEFGDKFVCMQSQKTIFEPIDNEIQKAIKEYLGISYFSANLNDYRNSTNLNAPVFDYSEVLFDPTKPIEEPQIKRKRNSQ